MRFVRGLWRKADKETVENTEPVIWDIAPSALNYEGEPDGLCIRSDRGRVQSAAEVSGLRGAEYLGEILLLLA